MCIIFSPLICVEVGSGSGIILTFLASILGGKSHYIGIDINEKASQCSQQSLHHHSIQSYDCICDNMLESLSPRLRGTVDVLLFNPPYVPTPSDEVGSTGLSASWAGGRHGREVIDLLLPQVDSFLSDGGVFYLLTVEENRPGEICQLMIAKGLIASKVLTRRARNELLTVLKFVKKQEK